MKYYLISIAFFLNVAMIHSVMAQEPYDVKTVLIRVRENTGALNPSGNMIVIDTAMNARSVKLRLKERKDLTRAEQYLVALKSEIDFWLDRDFEIDQFETNHSDDILNYLILLKKD